MKQVQFAQSIVFDQSQNQFMAQYLQYEACPFCNRKFFRGKLSLHLKLCNNDNPMLKSIKPKKSHAKNSQSTFDTNYHRCNICNTKIPKFLMERHIKNCTGEQNQDIKNNIKQIQIKQVKRKGNQVNFPRIQNSARQNMQRKANITSEIKKPQSSVKIRQQLRCFKKAEQVQKVICDNCGRKFSEKAALRHIPICQKLKKKQSFEISLQKQSKSLFTKTKLKSKQLKGQEKSKQSTSFFQSITTPVRQLMQQQIKQADLEQSMDNKEQKYQN